MDLKISYEDYIVIKDGVVSGSHLPSNVSFDNATLTLSLGNEINLHVIVLLSHDYTLNYHIGAHTHGNVIETRVLNSDAAFHRHFTVDEDAHINFFNENQSENQYHLTFKDEGDLKADSSLNMGYAELSDNNIEADYHYNLIGENADMHLRMAILSKEKERKHYKINLEHKAKHTTGIMDNYGVARDHGRLVIDGIGTINKGMSKSESHQTNKIMVFDKECFASANPYLFIDEYDVAASHAAAVGKMDENHLYYLESRGLTERQAMQLITYGYLKPVIHIVENETLEERFEASLEKVGA